AKRRRYRVLRKILSMAAGRSPSSVPESRADKKQEVPVAVNQLKSNLAFSAVGFATTGAARSTVLWRYGTFQPPSANAGVVALPMAVFTQGSPQHNTSRDKIANGIHALPICAAVWRRAFSEE